MYGYLNRLSAVHYLSSYEHFGGVDRSHSFVFVIHTRA